jgi:hypothetical protein
LDANFDGGWPAMCRDREGAWGGRCPGEIANLEQWGAATFRSGTDPEPKGFSGYLAKVRREAPTPPGDEPEHCYAYQHHRIALRLGDSGDHATSSAETVSSLT